MKHSALVPAVALASPAIWFASQAAQFAMAPLACAWQSNATLWAVSIIALLLDAGSGYVAWSEWRAQRGDAEATGSATMPRWLAMSGMALSVSFFFVIVAEWIPSLMLAGCE